MVKRTFSWHVGTIANHHSLVSTPSPTSKACAVMGAGSGHLRGLVSLGTGGSVLSSLSLAHLLEGFLKLRNGGGDRLAPPFPHPASFIELAIK